MLMERGWSIAAASSSTSLFLWLFALSVPAGGLIADRTGRSTMVLLGGLIGFAAALVLSPRVDAVTLAFILLRIVSGLPCGPIMSLPARVLTPETRSVGMGISFTVYYLIQVSAPWFVGHVAEIGGGPQVAFDLSAILLCTSGLVWVLYRQLSNDLVAETQVKAPS